MLPKSSNPKTLLLLPESIYMHKKLKLNKNIILKPIDTSLAMDLPELWKKIVILHFHNMS